MTKDQNEVNSKQCLPRGIFIINKEILIRRGSTLGSMPFGLEKEEEATISKKIAAL